jgi:myosin heavy subunit
MEDLGLSADEIHDVFSLVGAVLKLGNITFVPTTNMDGTEGCVISNDYGKSCKQKKLVIYDVTILLKFIEKIKD